MSNLPDAQKGLLLRSPLTYGFIPPVSFTQPKSIYSKDESKVHVLGHKDQEILKRNKIDTLAFYTRNNPHPFRVRHMKGLLDIPICSVEDQVEPRYLLSPPTGQDFGVPFRPKGSTRYSANVNKALPAVGVVPVTTAWRDELENKTKNALQRAMGQSLPSRGHGLDSQGGKRKQSEFDNLQDDKLLDWLCRILQTDSIPACQAWLASATDSEKDIVLNMIKMVACGELQGRNTSAAPSPRPHTSDVPSQNVWKPGKSQPKKKTIHEEDEDEEFNFPSLQKKKERKEEAEMGGMCEMEERLPNFPKSDHIIREAITLSRQASRGNGSTLYGGPQGVFGQRQKGVGIEELMAKWKKEVQAQEEAKKRGHRRSSSLHTPITSVHPARASALQHVKSLTEPGKLSASNKGGGVNGMVKQPPAPVKVLVTKEVIHQSKSGTPRLRYTSHWGKQAQ